MNYFRQLADAAKKLDAQANAYLERLPFLTTDETAKRLHAAAWRIFEAAGEDWEAVPDFVATICDGTMLYYGAPRRGSLKAALTFSCASQDAHLRNLLEIAEGRETEELPFPVYADVPIEPEAPTSGKPSKRRKTRT